MAALAHQHRLQQSPGYGLMGARAELLPHQIYIASKVAQRYAPRVLLADEVGLGKTIEAGLVLHQQLLTGRAERVLIVVPDSLVHQWLVEMSRRFNLQFTILDEERCQALDEAEPGNPFETAQCVLCALSFLTDNSERFEQSLVVDWDLLIVDEAHSTGVFGQYGRGLTFDLNLQSKVFARIHTFGKAMGCHGAVVVGELALKSYLINFARSFIYTTAMPLHNVLSIKYGLDELKTTEEIDKLWQNIKEFKRLVNLYGMNKYFLDSTSPIQSCLLTPLEKVKTTAHKLLEHNFDARPILSPTVSEGQERIRFCIHSYNTSSEIQEILFLLSTFA